MRFDKLSSERSAHSNTYTSKPSPTLQSVSCRNADRSRNCSVAQFLHILGHTCHPTTPSSPSRLRARVPIASSWADHGPTTGHGGPGHSACWRMRSTALSRRARAALTTVVIGFPTVHASDRYTRAMVRVPPIRMSERTRPSPAGACAECQTGLSANQPYYKPRISLTICGQCVQ